MVDEKKQSKHKKLMDNIGEINEVTIEQESEKSKRKNKGGIKEFIARILRKNRKSDQNLTTDEKQKKKNEEKEKINNEISKLYLRVLLYMVIGSSLLVFGSVAFAEIREMLNGQDVIDTSSAPERYSTKFSLTYFDSETKLQVKKTFDLKEYMTTDTEEVAYSQFGNVIFYEEGVERTLFFGGKVLIETYDPANPSLKTSGRLLLVDPKTGVAEDLGFKNAAIVGASEVGGYLVIDDFVEHGNYVYNAFETKVYDPETGEILYQFEMDPDEILFFAGSYAKNHIIFSSLRDREINIVDLITGKTTVLDEDDLNSRDIRDITIDPNGKTLYYLNSRIDPYADPSIMKYDMETGEVSSLGINATTFRLSPDGTKIYAEDLFSDPFILNIGTGNKKEISSLKSFRGKIGGWRDNQTLYAQDYDKVENGGLVTVDVSGK